VQIYCSARNLGAIHSQACRTQKNRVLPKNYYPPQDLAALVWAFV